VAAAPQPVFPIGCDELLPTSVLADALSRTPELFEDQDRDPDSLYDASELEVGMVHCVWSISKGTESSSASITLLPGATEDYDDYRQWVVPSAYEPVDTAGDRSDLYCWVNNVEGIHAWSCRGNLLVDDYWLAVSLSDTRKSTVAEEFARARMNEVLESLSSTIRSAGPAGPAWRVPPGQFGGDSLCDVVPSILADALDRAFTPVTPEGDGHPIYYAAQNRSGVVWCTNESKGRYATVGALPGGAWAFADRPPSSDYSAIEIEGSLYAWVSCGHDGCGGVAERQGDAVEFAWPSSSREKFAAAFARVLEGIDAA
jgi:hypothetical protein